MSTPLPVDAERAIRIGMPDDQPLLRAGIAWIIRGFASRDTAAHSIAALNYLTSRARLVMFAYESGRIS